MDNEQNTIKCIIFDLGGVFFRNDDLKDVGLHLSRKYDVAEEKVVEVIFRAWFSARTDPSQDDMFWRSISDCVGIPPDRILEEFIACPEPVTEMFDIARQLRKRYELGMLSNHILSWHSALMKKYDLESLFNVVVTSYGEGVAKPDVMIFQKVLDELKISPDEAVFIDDAERNVQAALSVGIHAVRFKGVEQLIDDLSKLGITDIVN